MRKTGLLARFFFAAAVCTARIPLVQNNIVLVGLMGAGKTTIGRLLAKAFSLPFIDSDHEIEARTGVKVPIIFEIEGEEGFRLREAQIVAELAQRQGLVIATGGGAVLNPVSRMALHACGVVVYLHAQPNDLWLRTRHDQNRPLLRANDPLARLAELYSQRDPLYREAAHLVVDTGRQSPRLLAGKIEQQLREIWLKLETVQTRHSEPNCASI